MTLAGRFGLFAAPAAIVLSTLATACSVDLRNAFAGNGGTPGGGSGGDAGQGGTGGQSGGSGGTGNVGNNGGNGGTGNVGNNGGNGGTGNVGNAGGTGGTVGPVCGDGTCEASEIGNCLQDCPPQMCAHDVCVAGEALAMGCSPCVDAICQNDGFCCNNGWDANCIAATNDPNNGCGAGCCGNGTCGDGETCGNCAQDCGQCVCGDGTCDAGAEDCASCPQDCSACVCGDGTCTGAAGEACDSCAVDCGLCQVCPHSVCAVGEPLDENVCQDSCAAEVCAIDMTCCGMGNSPGQWDPGCQQLAIQNCQGNQCIADVCAQIPSCCSQGWTQACIDAAKQLCNTGCDCPHSVCQAGDKLTPDCNPCAAEVCAVDPYCCDVSWDGICAGEAKSVCLIDCN